MDDLDIKYLKYKDKLQSLIPKLNDRVREITPLYFGGLDFVVDEVDECITQLKAIRKQKRDEDHAAEKAYEYGKGNKDVL